MLRHLFILIPLFLLSTALNAKEATIPLKHFNQMPMVKLPSISPDGKHIASILNQGDLTQVAIFPFEDKTKMQVLLQLGGEKYRIESIDWANNERILVTVTQPLRIADWNVRVRTTHIYSAKIDGSDVFEIRKKARDTKKTTFYRYSPDLLSLLEEEPDHILVTMNDERDDNYTSVFKVNVTNGDFEKYLPNTNRIVRWGVSYTGEVLLGVGVDKNHRVNTRYIYTRKNVDSQWKMVKSYEAYKTNTFDVVAYESKTNSIIVISDYKLKKNALWRFDIASGEYELLGEAPGTLDVTSAIIRLEGKKRHVVGFRYNDNFVKRVYFDENSNKFSQQITSLFGKSNLQGSLYDWDRNKQRYIISVVSDSVPRKYYIYDKKVNKIKPWYTQFPYLARVQLAKVQPFDFEARDGMKLHGYLTLPNNVKNPPVVLFPHGGPFSRDSQYFDPFVQMFASKGYAVLQVNFRGSTGYGNKYNTAGYHQWGKKMQTDLMDAMAWLKETKQADTDNACIVGASYGGYAALAAGYQTPDKFKCIVSIAGTANMQSTLNDWRRWGLKNYIENAVTSDEAELEKLSPVNHANKFKAPVLLIHGKVDTRVSYFQSKDMYDALKDAGKEVDLKLFKYGTHHLNDAVNRRDAMELMATFLEKHLD
ncbi:MAG: S9 family peptidase [Alteromonadaceae bacterium]|nr:S9 family peptidase [Alteromonadaceae bacterium]